MQALEIPSYDLLMFLAVLSLKSKGQTLEFPDPGNPLFFQAPCGMDGFVSRGWLIAVSASDQATHDSSRLNYFLVLGSSDVCFRNG